MVDKNTICLPSIFVKQFYLTQSNQLGFKMLRAVGIIIVCFVLAVWCQNLPLFVGKLATVAGTGGAGNQAYGEAPFKATLTEMNTPRAPTLDKRRNILYIADSENSCVRAVDLNTNVISIVSNVETLIVNSMLEKRTKLGMQEMEVLQRKRCYIIHFGWNMMLVKMCCISATRATGVCEWWIANPMLFQLCVRYYTLTSMQFAGGGTLTEDNVPALNAAFSDYLLGVTIDTLYNQVFISDYAGSKVRVVNRTSGMIRTVCLKNAP